VGAEFVDALTRLESGFADYMKTLAVKPDHWTRDRLGAAIDVTRFEALKINAMQAHRTQTPDLNMWNRVRAKVGDLMREETFIRAFPEPGGPPLETDLFASLRQPVRAG